MLSELNQTQVPLPWQEAQWQSVVAALKSGRSPHGIMLRGEPGTGKGQFALALAQYLLCEKPVADTACGRCKACQLNAVSTHPDLVVIEPEEQDKAIKVDQVRSVVDFVSKKAQMDGYRVVVLCPAEAMNVNAANALLKSLEEPGENTLLILVSHQISGVLATVRSRCQVMDFNIPERQSSLAWLNNIVGDSQRSEKLLNMAGGAPIKALALNESEWVGERAAVLQQWLGVLNGKRDPIRTAQSWNQYPLRELLVWLLAWQADVAKLLADAETKLLNQDLHQDLSLAAKQVDPGGLFNCYQHLLQMKSFLVSQANPNPQLLLEEVLLKWSQARIR